MAELNYASEIPTFTPNEIADILLKARRAVKDIVVRMYQKYPNDPGIADIMEKELAPTLSVLDKNMQWLKLLGD
jgi:hypothetical protein